MPFRGIQNLLHTRDQGSEGGNDNPTFRLVENFIEGVIDHAFRSRPTGAFSVGGISQQREHASARKFCHLL